MGICGSPTSEQLSSILALNCYTASAIGGRIASTDHRTGVKISCTDTGETGLGMANICRQRQGQYFRGGRPIRKPPIRGM